MFMSSSMKAAIHLGPNHLANLEVFKNTNFEEIQSLFNVTQNLILEHLKKFWMWIRLTVHLFHGRDQYCPTIKWSSGQKRKCVSTQIPFYLWEGWMTAKMRLQDGKVKWNIFPGFSSLQILQEIQNDSRRRNIEPEKITDRIIFCVSVQWHRLDKKRKWWNLYFEFGKSHGIREEILARTLDVLGPGSEKKWYGTLSYTPEGKWDSRFKGTGHPVLKSISDLRRGILKKKNGRDTIHFNADASNTELTFRNIHSVSQLSIHGAVANWCEQFGLTEKEEGKERQKESVIKGVLTSVKSQEVKLLVSRPKRVSGSSLREKNQDFESLTQGNSQGFANLHCSGTGYHLGWITKLDLTRTTVLGRSFHYAENTRFLEWTHNPECLQQFLEEQLLDQSLESRSWKFLTKMDLKLQFHDPTVRNGHLMFWFTEERVCSWKKSTFPMPYSDPVQNYSLNFRKQKERNVRSTVSSHTSNKDTGANSQHSSQPSVPFHAKNHSYERERERESGRLFLSMIRIEEFSQYRSPKWLQEWCVIMIKMNDNLTPQFIGTR